MLGFNSGGYDIPLKKPWLFSELVSLTSDESVEFVKKSSTRYMSLTVYGLPHEAGGFVFLDIMQYRMQYRYNTIHYRRNNNSRR